MSKKMVAQMAKTERSFVKKPSYPYIKEKKVEICRGRLTNVIEAIDIEVINTVDPGGIDNHHRGDHHRGDQHC